MTEHPHTGGVSSAAEIALNSQLKQAFEQRDPDLDAIQSYLKRQRPPTSRWMCLAWSMPFDGAWRKKLNFSRRSLPI